MAGYSKEAERQNKALGNLLKGQEVEKRTIVGYEGKKKEKGDIKSELTDIMSEVRMPLFCPKCKKTMKKKLDTKFWRTKGHCFDCQIEFENRLRLEGKFEDYAKNIELENKKSYLNDLKQSIDEFEDSDGKVEWLNSVGVQDVELEREKWEMGKTEFSHVVKEARDYITKIENEIDEEAKKLNIT